MDLSNPSISSGLPRNCCNDGIITVEAKSGRVSRSRHWAMLFDEPINSAAFFWNGLYFDVSASLGAATLFGLDVRKMLAASPVPRYCRSCLAPSGFLGDLA